MTDAEHMSTTTSPTTDDAIIVDGPPTTLTRRILKIVVRIVVVVGALTLSFWILARTFDDLDASAIVDAIDGLQDADLIALGAMWLLWIAAQGLLTASLVPDLPVRRGVVAFLGPAAIASVVPGPSDLPIRHRMLTSWGRSGGEATLAVAAGGIFSVGIKLVLPIIAAVGLLVSDAPLSSALKTVVSICLLVGVGIVIAVVVLGSERRTEQAGRLIAPIWSRALKLLRKPTPADLPAQLVDARANAVQTLRGRWLVATWATGLTSASRFALLLMCLRFTGVSEAVLPWTEIFVVFALVQGLTVFPITAGEAGVSEIAYIGLLTAAAGSEFVNEITAAILVFRMITWLLIIPVGLGTLGFWKLQLRRHPTVTPGV